MAKAPLRRIRTWNPKLAMDTRPDGSIHVWREDPLGPWERSVTDPLIRWAREAPERVWMAERAGPAGDGEWQRVTYAEALAQVRAIAAALLNMGLSAERPLAILSGNSIGHALMALAAQHVGIPSAAIAPAYSLAAADPVKLREVARQLTPGLIYAEDGARFRAAIEAVFPPDLPVVSRTNPLPGRGIALDDLVSTRPDEAVDRAHQAVGPDTIAKFLFTSGTTGSPKAVIQTHGNIASNQAMVLDAYAFLRDTPPVIVDWAPWNHVAAGTKVFYLSLFNGGSYHIDAGKPTPEAIGTTLRNLREVAPTWYFNVPAGHELLVRAMEEDAALARNFFSRLQYLMYAGAPMSRHCWDRLAALSERAVGERVLRSSSLGATETGPFALCGMVEEERPDNVGIPAQGVHLKLVPVGDKLECRIKSPSVTPGYWRNPALTAQAFDEEGFYRLGDAIRFAVPGRPEAGFFFDGRLAENFKLVTGTFVAVGPLRGRLVNEMGGLVRDAVLAGEGRAEIGALMLPDIAALRALIGSGDSGSLDDAAVLAHPAVRRALAERLAAHAAAATGSASRVARAILLDSPPEPERGEITDKGSLNQRNILRNRADLVAALYDDADPRVILARSPARSG
ncbi:MAG: feruloyl-CoA synthase [Alphaproteobacteria bacterium]|nr:MAG: feruloyl-CoA synthase [Alphaproteobacteria bacterium]